MLTGRMVRIHKIILDEVDVAERLLSGEASMDSPYDAAKLLGRYYRQKTVLNEEEIEDRIKAFVEERYPELPVGSSLWEKIPAYVEYGDQYKLNEIEYVPVYQEELDDIARFKDRSVQCFAFAVLAVSRYETMRSKNKDGWIAGDRWGEIERRANLSLGKNGKYLALHQLVKSGYVEMGNGVTNISAKPLRRVDDGEVAIRLYTPDFDDLGYCYRHYLGENFTKCLECGRWMRQPKTGRPRSYCGICSPVRQRAYWAENKRKNRALKKCP